MPKYRVTLVEDGGKQTVLERDDSETVRDLIKSTGVRYHYETIRYVTDFDGVPLLSRVAPFTKDFLDHTLSYYLIRDDDPPEEDTVILYVRKYSEEKKQQIVALKKEVDAAKARLDAAKEALYAAAEPAQRGGRRKTYRRHRK